MTQDSPLPESEEPIGDDMVIVQPTQEHRYYMHMILKSNMDNLKKEVLKKDYDGFVVLDGQEGTGKSTLALQLALYCDPTFNLSRVVFTIDQFLEAVENATKGQAIVFDETMGYLGSRGSMSKFNRVLIKVFSEMRSKNLFIFLNIPSFFELDKYPAIHRSVCLLHIHKRGDFLGFNYNSKKLLYVAGKKFYSYSFPSASFIGSFVKYFPIDKKAYEEKKKKSIFEYNDAMSKEKKIQEQRNKLVRWVYANFGVTEQDIADVIGLEQTTVHYIINEKTNDNKINHRDEEEEEDEEDDDTTI